jgi:predicted transcriptional regulator
MSRDNFCQQKEGCDLMTVETISTNEQEKEKLLFEELDKGIDDMEAGRVVTHEEAMRIIRERVENYAV